MKIRINNIFVNKKTDEKKKNIKEHKEIESVKVSLRYKNFKLKKVYDSKSLDGLNSNVSEIVNKEEISRKANMETVDNYNLNNEKRRRKGYSSLKVINSSGKEKKIKVYYNNLVRNKNKLKRGYYVLLIAMVTLGIGSVTLALKTYKMFNTEDYEVFSNIDNNVEEQIIETDNIKEEEEELSLQSNETSNKDTISELEEKSESTSNNTSIQTTTTKTIEKIVPLSFSKPVDGEILKPYSIDKVIYSKTLELWKTHDGIDIKVDEGNYIKSIERGTVEKVYEDSFYGVTIVIDHGQGYKSSYSNLDKETLVKEKQNIIKGQKIGKVGKTAIGEIKDESHIHFMLFKNGQNADPTSIFS